MWYCKSEKVIDTDIGGDYDALITVHTMTCGKPIIFISGQLSDKQQRWLINRHIKKCNEQAAILNTIYGQ